jgi:hypothetical protein
MVARLDLHPHPFECQHDIRPIDAASSLGEKSK